MCAVASVATDQRRGGRDSAPREKRGNVRPHPVPEPISVQRSERWAGFVATEAAIGRGRPAARTNFRPKARVGAATLPLPGSVQSQLSAPRTTPAARTARAQRLVVQSRSSNTAGLERP